MDLTTLLILQINRDPVAAEMQRMRSQLEQLQSELLFCRGGGAPLEELQVQDLIDAAQFKKQCKSLMIVTAASPAQNIIA